MDFEAFLDEIRSEPAYAGQMVHVRRVPPREARYGAPRQPLPAAIRAVLAGRGVGRLYCHQAQAIDSVAEGRDTLIVTGTASGKSLCYLVPLLQTLLAGPHNKAMLLFPTKALCQDQFNGVNGLLAGAGMGGVLAGVYDGDTAPNMRRKLRDDGSVLLTNPDMLHAALMPSHSRWAAFLSRLKLLVIDELHVYSGMFGSNMGNLLRRFFRVCAHYGSSPRVIACSATIGNPGELAHELTGRGMAVIDDDGSPRGRRTVVFWNPPQVRGTMYRSRRSANVEAHELMALLIQHGAATITFSKAKMTAEMIHRYVSEKLSQTAPQLAGKVSPYRGGYLPEERRQIERRLFSGELLGVSTTPALELGIDVGGLDASILVGYPGTIASFLQQAGRAGRRDRDALAILVGLDTAVNQYVMEHPEYVLGRPVEQAVIDPDNPFIVTGHLRCAAHELPLGDGEPERFGPHAPMVLRLLEENLKVRLINGKWYHAAAEVPQHEVGLRGYADENVVIQEAGSGRVLGEVNKFDAPPILHPEAIYIHRGDTYRVLSLDLERNVATVKREEVDYYTQPLGGTDVHHIDHCLREKAFGSGRAHWGEVTAYFQNGGYEKIHFYSLDAISRHNVDLPRFVLETMAFWIVPPEPLMEQVRRAGLDVHSGLRGIGYATRMLLPLYITCDTLDFSHSVGSANSPWNAVFIYERYPHGLGFTQKAFDHLHEIMPAVLENIRQCPCEDGCPCCVGKPLRQYRVWNPERGEASIPSKRAAAMILERMLADKAFSAVTADDAAPSQLQAAADLRLEQALRRRLERMREPQVDHPIEPNVPTQYPKPETPQTLATADVARRSEQRRSLEKDFRKRLAQRLAGGSEPAPAPVSPLAQASDMRDADQADKPAAPIEAGDSLAAKARRRRGKPEGS